MTLMKVIITFTFCCDNLQKSKFMALKKPGKLTEFFSPTLWPPCLFIYLFVCSFVHLFIYLFNSFAAKNSSLSQ